MKEQVREFSYREQKVQDILRAIDVLEPVVFLIREYEQTQHRLKPVIKRNKEIDFFMKVEQKQMHSSIKRKPSLYGTPRLRFLLEEKKVMEKYKEKLSSTVEELNHLIYDEYIEYSNSFIEINEDLAEKVAIHIKYSESIERFLAMLLLVFNNGLKEEKRQRIFHKLWIYYQENPNEEVKILDITKGNQSLIISYIKNHF